jgi:hypothetical protein
MGWPGGGVGWHRSSHTAPVNLFVKACPSPGSGALRGLNGRTDSV